MFSASFTRVSPLGVSDLDAVLVLALGAGPTSPGSLVELVPLEDHSEP